MSKHDIHLKKGEILKNQYQIVKEIGAGGMSIVYLAVEIDKQTLVAIKVADMTRKISRRLFSEAKILSELDHPALPQIVDFFSSEDNRYFYLVQEYINGQPLQECFEQQESIMNQEEVIQIGITISEVLHYLHTRKPNPIIYRDLKPANIMITNEGAIKLIDFGIARKYVHNQLKDTVQIGTVGFAAPEQFEKRQSDARTDLFSLGALMYYLLTGGRYVYISQKPVGELRKGLTKSLKQCIKLLVKTNPDERVQSADKTRELLIKAKEETKRASTIFVGTEWMAVKYIVAISFFLGVVLYIISDQINR